MIPSPTVNTPPSLNSAHKSPLPVSEMSKTPTTVESAIPTDGIDDATRELIWSYNPTLPSGEHILSSPTHILPDIILHQPANSLTKCFAAIIWITIERTIPPTTAHTITSPHQGILNVYVCPPSVTFARTGDTPTNSAMVDVVTVVIPADMCLMIV